MKIAFMQNRKCDSKHLPKLFDKVQNISDFFSDDEASLSVTFEQTNKI